MTLSQTPALERPPEPKGQDFATNTLLAGTAAPAPSPSPTPAPTAAPPSSTYVAEPLHDIPTEVDPLLVLVLSWPRAHGSAAEAHFAKFLREWCRGQGDDVKVEVMTEGNLMVTVPRPSKADQPAPPKPSTTLFSCHIDSIEDHSSQGTGAFVEVDGELVPVRKKLTYDPHFGLIGLDKDSIGGSLGADDGAGVWLMMRMIQARVPGTYMFHRGEECGCIGSRAMADKHHELLAYFEAAIAFDRRDNYEVITHQGGIRTCSEKFAKALAERLTSKGMKFQPSDKGLLTDTKQYRHIIAECTNIGVGYTQNHGRNETLDYAHLNALLDACCAIDWDSLPIDRDPKAYEPTYNSRRYSNGRAVDWDSDWDLGQAGYTQDPVSGHWTRKSKPSGQVSMFPGGQQHAGKGKKKKGQQRKGQDIAVTPWMPVSEELGQFSLEEIQAWAEQDPGGAATAIGQLLVEVAGMRGEVAKKDMELDMAMQLLGFKEEK